VGGNAHDTAKTQNQETNMKDYNVKLLGLAAGAAIAAATAAPMLDPIKEAHFGSVYAKAQAIALASQSLREELRGGQASALAKIGLADPWSAAPAFQGPGHGNGAACMCSACSVCSCTVSVTTLVG
jgi:hypothetical protein